MNKQRTAYSLAEIIMVVLILGALAFIAVPRLNLTALHHKQAHTVAKKIVTDLRRTRSLAIANAAVNNAGFQLKMIGSYAALPAPPPASPVAYVPVSHAPSEPVFLLSVSVTIPTVIATTAATATSSITSSTTATSTATTTATATASATASTTATSTSTTTASATATSTSTTTSTGVAVSGYTGYQIVDANSGTIVDSQTIDSPISCTGGSIFKFGPLGNLLSGSGTQLTVTGDGRTYTITVISGTGTVECTGG